MFIISFAHVVYLLYLGVNKTYVLFCSVVSDQPAQSAKANPKQHFSHVSYFSVMSKSTLDSTKSYVVVNCHLEC